ncbi:MAG: hypothetical protein AB1782_12545 [Cyanobacteriota bacterium]
MNMNIVKPVLILAFCISILSSQNGALFAQQGYGLYKHTLFAQTNSSNEDCSSYLDEGWNKLFNTKDLDGAFNAFTKAKELATKLNNKELLDDALKGLECIKLEKSSQESIKSIQNSLDYMMTDVQDLRRRLK